MARRFIKTLLTYAAILVINVFFAVILLLMGTYLPNHPIEKNLIASLPVLEREGMYHHSGDYTDATKLDGFTDALILQGSLLARWSDQEAILTNPFYGDPSYPVDALLDLLGSKEYVEYDEPDWYYARYWMGFRTIMRVLLSCFDYPQIRTLVSNTFFILLSLCAGLIAYYVSARASVALLIAVFLVKPQIICNSLQYSSCFLIAFIAMLFVPYIHRHPRFEALFFFELGIITMYFDFYTVPTIAFGFPLVFLLLMDAKEGRKLMVSRVFGALMVFLAGWVLMWLAKLLLTDAMTDVDGIYSGLESMAGRLGFVKPVELTEYYSVWYAFECVLKTILPEKIDWVMAATGLLIVVVYAVYMTRMKRFAIRKSALFAMLFVACIPMLWFAATAQPTSIHAFFQYRNIALTYFSLGVCFSLGEIQAENDK